MLKRITQKLLNLSLQDVWYLICLSKWFMLLCVVIYRLSPKSSAPFMHYSAFHWWCSMKLVQLELLISRCLLTRTKRFVCLRKGYFLSLLYPPLWTRSIKRLLIWHILLGKSAFVRIISLGILGVEVVAVDVIITIVVVITIRTTKILILIRRQSSKDQAITSINPLGIGSSLELVCWWDYVLILY